MKKYKLLLSLFSSYKLYVFFIFILFTILIYSILAIKSVNKIYEHYITYKYGFVPEFAIYTDKNTDIANIINGIKKENIDFKYKIGAIKNIQNVVFSSDNYKSLPMDISIMGLYFEDKIYINIKDDKELKKCKINKIRQVYKSWIFDVSKCNIKNKFVHFGTDNMKLKVLKAKNSYKLKTYKPTKTQIKSLFKYLEEIINQFDDINHIGIQPPAYLNKTNTNDDLLEIEQHKQRAIRDYLGIIFSQNDTYISTLVSKNIYKNISWLKRRGLFIDLNSSGDNLNLFVYNYFLNKMQENTILIKYTNKVFKNDYKQFIFLYTSQKEKLQNILFKSSLLKNTTIQSKEDILNNHINTKGVYFSISIIGYFIYTIVFMIAIMGLNRFYKKFKKPLFLAKSFGAKIPIYTIYLVFILIVSSIFSYILFYYTNIMVNHYMQMYFYPSIIFPISYLMQSIGYIGCLFIIFSLYELKLHKELSVEY